MSKTNISNVIDILAVCRDDYRKKYDDSKAQYDKCVERIKNDYKPNTETYKRALASAKEKHEKTAQSARSNTREIASEYIRELLEDEKAAVSVIDTNAMQKLASVSNLPMTAKEIEVLRDKYAPRNEYWASRMIIDLAEKNGFKASQFFNSATFDTKCDLLNELSSRLDEFLNSYNGETRYRTDAVLCDSVLHQAEKKYLKYYSNATMEEEQIARRAFVQLKGKSAIEQMVAIQNILANLSEEGKRAFYYEVEENRDEGGAAVLYDSLMYLEGAGEFEEYRKNEHQEYKQAKDSLKKAMLAKNCKEVKKIAEDMDKNRYFNKMLEGAEETEKYIGEYMELKRQEAEANE